MLTKHPGEARLIATLPLRSALTPCASGCAFSCRSAWATCTWTGWPATLSAGEAQRIRLAGLLGSGLTSLTVLLDEPTRGLHPSRWRRCSDALTELRDEGNTVIVVEHDPLVMRAADYLIDWGRGPAGGRRDRGPGHAGAGRPGRHAHGPLAARRARRRKLDARPRREPTRWLTIRGARANNLRGETVALAAGRAGGRVRRVRLGQEHAADRHAGAGAGAEEADHLGGL